jgi:hypothetical protein
MIQLQQIALFAILCAVIHWFVARSSIMRWFWSRATGWLAELLICPACSGFWIGLLLDVTGISPLGPSQHWGEVLLSGALGLFFTPLAEALLLWGIDKAAVREAPPED